MFVYLCRRWGGARMGRQIDSAIQRDAKTKIQILREKERHR